MIKYRLFLGVTILQVGLVFALYQKSQRSLNTSYQQQLNDKRQIVHLLGLTDLSIWTEARYTRHPTQTDFFSPFQDFPASLEHFPAGSIISPIQLRAHGNGNTEAFQEDTDD